jgi:hypothetical protein
MRDRTVQGMREILRERHGYELGGHSDAQVVMIYRKSLSGQRRIKYSPVMEQGRPKIFTDDEGYQSIRLV